MFHVTMHRHVLPDMQLVGTPMKLCSRFAHSSSDWQCPEPSGQPHPDALRSGGTGVRLHHPVTDPQTAL